MSEIKYYTTFVYFVSALMGIFLHKTIINVIVGTSSVFITWTILDFILKKDGVVGDE